jgi:hypothetical protein
MKREIPIEVSRKINNFASGMEGSEKVTMIRDHEKAYLEMIEKLEKAEIPQAEKDGIAKNVENMFPGNYVRQNIEVTSMIDTVLTVKANMK